jgi:hypothetical protein
MRYKVEIDKDMLVSPFAIEYMNKLSGSDDMRFASHNKKTYVNSEYVAQKLLETGLKTSDEMVRELPRVWLSIMREIRKEESKTTSLFDRINKAEQTKTNSPYYVKAA